MADDSLFGGSGVGLLIILFFIMGGFGGNGFGWGGNGGVATSNEVQRGFDNQNSMANQREILAAVNAGTAQSVAATNQMFHDLVGYVGDKYTELDRDVLGINSLIQQSIANENQCCCNTLRAIDSVKYENSQNTNKILEAMAQNKMDAMAARINQLELQQATSNIVRYPSGWTYNAGQSPFCSGCGM